MEPEKTPVRMKIILATIDCIERHGIDTLTVRRIAKAAGVNVAAINYYFGSRRKLVEAALDKTMDHFFEDMERALRRKGSAEDTAREVLTYVLAGGLRFPNVTRAHLHDPLVHGTYGGRFTRQFNDLLRDLLIRTAGPGRANRQAAMALMQAVAAVTLVILLPGFFDKFSGVRLEDPAQQKEYVDHALRNVFGNRG